MLPRFRKRVFMAGAALTVAATLSSCGFNYATDQIYISGEGVDHRTGEVDTLSAVVVSGAANSGTLITTFINNNNDEADTVEAISGDGLTVQGFQPIEIPAAGLVNLATNGSKIALKGNFAAGGYAQVSITFARQGQVNLKLPVVPNSGWYAGLDTTAPPPSAEESAAPAEEAH